MLFRSDLTQQVSGTMTVADADANQSSFQAGSQTGTYGTLSLQSNGQWTYTLNNGSTSVQSLRENDQVTETFTVKTADGTTKSVTVTVNGTNDAPVIGGTASGSVTEDGTQSASGTLTITDADTGQASFNAGTQAGTYGTLSLQSNGQWTYQLNNGSAAVQGLTTGQAVTENITVTSADGTTKQISITINGTNDAPVIGGTATGSVTEDTTQSVSGTLTISDADANQSSFNAITQTGTYGTLSLQSNGQWTYTLNNNSSVVQGLKSSDHPVETDRKSTRLNSSHVSESRMPSSA